MPRAMRRIPASPRLLLLPALLSVAGCGSWSNPIDNLPRHRIEIQQGNLVTQDMVDKLKPGMTPSQVRFILGTPLVVDPFRKNRWDYVYRVERGGKVQEQRRISVVFEEERLKAVEGDITPAQVKSAPAPAPNLAPTQTEESKK